MAGNTTDVDLVLSASLGQFVAGLNEATQRLTSSLETMRTSAQKETSEIDAAFERLGVRRFADIEREVDEVKAAFERLKASGELSSTALVQAQVRMEEQIRDLRRETGGWAESLDKVKVQAIAAAASLAGVVRVLGGAAGEAADFGLKMAEVSTLLNDTSGVDALSDSVRRLAREFGSDAGTQAQALYDIISAGASDAAAATEILTQANVLAVGGVTDVATAADGLTSALNAYGLSADQAQSVADKFFVAVKAGKTTVEELSGSIGQVAPIAATMGVSIEELLAAVAALTKGNGNTATSVTQLRGALSAMLKPTKEAKDTAEELGIQFDAAAIQSKGLAGFLADVAEKAGGNQEAMARLFGSVEGLQGVLALTGSQAESFAGTLDGMAESAGEASAAAEKIAETDAQGIREWNAALADMRISLGEAVLALTPLLEALTVVVNGFNALPEPIRQTIAAVVALTAVVAPLAVAWAALKGPLTLLSATALPALGASLTAAAASAGAAAASAGVLLLRIAPIAALLTGVAVAAKFGADALSDYALAQRMAVADAAYAETLREEIAARQAQAEALRSYADVAVLSAEQIAALGETERAAYLARLQSAKDYESAVSGVLVRQRELEGSTEANTAALAANRARQEELNAGLAAFQQSLQKAADTAQASLAPAVLKLADDLRQAATSSDEAEKALKSLFEGISADAPSGEINRIVSALGELAGGSDAVAVTLRDRLGVALRELSGTELAAFQAATMAAMGEGKANAEGLAVVLDTVVAESLRQLGANALTIGETFTEAGKNALGAFNAIATSGQASAQQILAAYNLALAKLSTPVEIEALLGSLRKVGPAAGLSLGQLETAAAAAAQAIGKVKSAQGQVDEAALRSQIRKLEDEYTDLLRSGTATAAELGKVRQSLADLNGQLAASQGAGQEAGDAMESAGNRGADAFDRVTSSAGRAAGALDETGRAARDSKRDLDSAASALNEIGNNASSAEISLGRMSEQFARAAMDAAGSARSARDYLATWNSFTDAYEQQNRAFERRLEASQQTIAALDAEEQALARLRAEFGAISDGELKRLLETERRAKELREQSTDTTVARTDAERNLRRELEQTSQASSSGGLSVSRRIELVLRVQNEQANGGAELRLSQAQIREIADRVIAEIRRDQSL